MSLCELEDATTFCLICKEFYCDSCQKGHKKMKMSASHTFVSVDDGWKIVSASTSTSDSASALTVRSSHCLKHPQQEINTFCNNDQEFVCPQCAVQFHSGHTFTLLENLILKFKDEITPRLIQVLFIFSFSLFLFSSSFPSFLPFKSNPI